MTRLFNLCIGLSFIIISCGQNRTFDSFDYNQSKVDSAKIDANTDIQNGDIFLITYGTPSLFISYNIDSLAETYGFYYKNAGCMYDTTDEAYTKSYNKIVIDFLEKRNGKNWYEKFEATADSLVK